MPSGAPILVGATRGFKSIQSAIDDNDTRDGDLIPVEPGPVPKRRRSWKIARARLGYGAPATIMNASMVKLTGALVPNGGKNARDLVLNQGMAAALLPGQTVPGQHGGLP